MSKDENIEKKLDQLTRNKISKEMNVPSELVSKTTPLYLKTFEELKNTIPSSKLIDLKDDFKDNLKNDKVESKKIVSFKPSINSNINYNSNTQNKNDFIKNYKVNDYDHQSIESDDELDYDNTSSNDETQLIKSISKEIQKRNL